MESIHGELSRIMSDQGHDNPKLLGYFLESKKILSWLVVWKKTHDSDRSLQG